MDTFANSEDPDEMPHNATIYQSESALFASLKFIFIERTAIFIWKLYPLTYQYLQWTILILCRVLTLA